MAAVKLIPNTFVNIVAGPSLDEILGHLGRREPLTFRVATRDGVEFNLQGDWGFAGSDTRSEPNDVNAWHIRLIVDQPDGTKVNIGFNYRSDTRKGTAKVFPNQR